MEEVVAADLKSTEDRLVRLAKYFLHHDASDHHFKQALKTKALLLEHYPEEHRENAWALFVTRAGGNSGYRAMTSPPILISLNNRLSPQELVNAGVFYRDFLPVKKHTKLRDAAWQVKIRPFLIGLLNTRTYNTNDAIKAYTKLITLPANAHCDEYKHALRELIFSRCKQENFHNINPDAMTFYQQLHNIYLFLGGNISFENIVAGGEEEQQRQGKMDKQARLGFGTATGSVLCAGAYSMGVVFVAPSSSLLWIAGYAPCAAAMVGGIGVAGVSKINRNYPAVSSCWNPAAPIQHYREDQKVKHPVFVQMVDSSVKTPVKKESSIFSSMRALFFCCTGAEDSGELKPLLSINADERSAKTKAM